MSLRNTIRAAAALAACCAGALTTLQATAQTAQIAPGPSAGSVLQMFLGLAVVLGVFGAVAWMLKRAGNIGAPNHNVLKLVGSIAVGTRERVVLIEVGEQWIVAGVAPGAVNQLATMPRGDTAEIEFGAAGVAPSNAFAGFLKQVMEKRNGK